MESFDVDHDFFPILGMEIVKGRNFSPESGKGGGCSVIINETAVKRFNWDDPIGKTIRAPSEDVGKWERCIVVGVVKDFHRASLRSVIGSSSQPRKSLSAMAAADRLMARGAPERSISSSASSRTCLSRSPDNRSR